MQIDQESIEKIEALAQLLGRDARTVLHEALDSYLQKVRESLLEEDLEKHRKETNLSFDEFWGDVEFDD